MTMLDRLAARYGYVRRVYPRMDNGADAIARGQRWEAFYRENGGLADMIATLRRAYFEKVGALKPGDTDALMALGIADRVAREIEREVQTVIETGKLRADQAEQANLIANIRR